jgi:hypothetical protein
MQVAKTSVKLKVMSTCDLDKVRRLLLTQHEVRTRDCECFYLKGYVLVDSWTIGELMRDHSPKLDPKVDTLHAAERTAPNPLPQHQPNRQSGKGGAVERDERGEEEEGGAGSSSSALTKQDKAKLDKFLKKHTPTIHHVAFMSSMVRDETAKSIIALSPELKLGPAAAEVLCSKLQKIATKTGIDIADACKKIMKGQVQLSQLRPSHRRWSPIEEAVVNKVLLLARQPFLKLLTEGAEMGRIHKMAAETDSSGSEKEEAGSDSDQEEEDASLASWERVFNRFNKFWRRLACIAALRTHSSDALVEAELEYFGPVIEDLHSANWMIKLPIQRIILEGVRLVEPATVDSDSNSKKKIGKLLKWVKEEEAKLASAGESGLFQVVDVAAQKQLAQAPPGAAVESEAVESAAERKAVQKYDRVCQLLASLASEPAESETRNKMRQTAVDKLGPFLQKRGVEILSAAQRLWVLVDAAGGVEDKVAYIAQAIDTERTTCQSTYKTELQALNPLLPGDESGRAELEGKTVKGLREVCMSKGIDTSKCSDKRDLVDLVFSNASATAAAADAAARITRALTGTKVQILKQHPVQKCTNTDVRSQGACMNTLPLQPHAQTAWQADVRRTIWQCLRRSRRPLSSGFGEVGAGGSA